MLTCDAVMHRHATGVRFIAALPQSKSSIYRSNSLGMLGLDAQWRHGARGRRWERRAQSTGGAGALMCVSARCGTCRGPTCLDRSIPHVIMSHRRPARERGAAGLKSDTDGPCAHLHCRLLPRRQGLVMMLRRVNGMWQLAQTLTLANDTSLEPQVGFYGADFGHSVALSGPTLIVGARSAQPVYPGETFALMNVS